MDEICEEFGISHRTVLHMTDALETMLMDVEAEGGDYRRRRGRFADPMLDRLQPRQETAIEALETDGRVRNAYYLGDLRDDLLARLAPKDAALTEVDAEDVLTALKSVTRSGSRVNLAPKVLDAVIEAGGTLPSPPSRFMLTSSTTFISSRPDHFPKRISMEIRMAGSVNKVIIIGNLGQDPEVRSFANGGKVVNLRVATSESWKDKSTGERKERTEWHSVAIFSEPLGKIAEQYLRKGSKVYIEGQIETRKWQDQSGADRYSTEVVLRQFGGTLTLLDGRSGDSQGEPYGGIPFQENRGSIQDQRPDPWPSTSRVSPSLDDEIPF